MIEGNKQILPEPAMVLDIETAPSIEEARRLRPLPFTLENACTQEMWEAEENQIIDILETKARSYKRSNTIAEKVALIPSQVEDHMAKWKESFSPDTWMSDAALDPTRSTLAAFAFDWVEAPAPMVTLIDNDDEEQWLYALLTGIQKARCIIGHNVRDFDLWWLVQRARILGVTGHAELYHRVFVQKPWESDLLILDCYEAGRVNKWAGLQTQQNATNATKPGGRPSYGLDSLCRMYGLEGKTIPDGGKRFSELSKEEKHAYLEGDLKATERLARHLFENYIWPNEQKTS